MTIDLKDKSFKDDSAAFLIAMLLFSLAWRYAFIFKGKYYFNWRAALLPVVLFLTSVLLALIILFYFKRHKRQGNLMPQKWPKMSGVQFEDQMVIWLKINGYDPVIKTEYFDRGIDIIAHKGGVRYGVQVKRATKAVGVAAVRAAVAGLSSYNCDVPVVMTNSVFTAQAETLAAANNCLLINGTKLLAGCKQKTKS